MRYNVFARLKTDTDFRNNPVYLERHGISHRYTVIQGGSRVRPASLSDVEVGRAVRAAQKQCGENLVEIIVHPAPV